MFPDIDYLFSEDINFLGFDLCQHVQTISELIYLLLKRGPSFYGEHVEEFLQLKSNLDLLIPKLDDFTNNYPRSKRGNDRQSQIRYDLKEMEVLSLFCQCESIYNKLKK